MGVLSIGNLIGKGDDVRLVPVGSSLSLYRLHTFLLVT